MNKHQCDRAAAETAIAEATSIRRKEASAYAAVKAESSSHIAEINKALAALEDGAGGASSQTQSANVLRSIVKSKVSTVDADRAKLMSFIFQDSGYFLARGEIAGILKKLGEEMSASLDKATTVENEAIKSFEGFIDAKRMEIAAVIAKSRSRE